jgi:hypothetical protein
MVVDQNYQQERIAQTLAFTESLRLFVLSRDARRAQADEGNRPNKRRDKQHAIN